MSNRIEVKVDGNASGFKHTMDTVRTQAKATADSVTHSWSRGIVGGIVGAFSFEAIRGAVESFISNAKGIKDMAEQLEMSTDATQKWAKAADEVGQSLTGIYSVMSAIQSKRQEALRDPKAADLFSMLGVSREQVLGEDNSEFAKRVLAAGGKDSESRQVLEQIVGRRGLKLIPAASRYDEAKPDLDSNAIKAADDAEKSEKRLFSSVGRMIGSIFSWVDRATTDSMNKEKESERRIRLGDEKGGLLWNWLHRDDGDKVMHVEEVYRKQFGSPAQSANTSTEAAPDNPTEDPMDGIMNQRHHEFDLQNSEAEMGLHAAQRGNMTIAGRKKSIKADLASLKQEIEARTAAADSQLIYGLTQKQQGQMGQSDIENQLHTDYLKLVALQTKAQGFTNELRENRGFNFSADSLARVGLYSSSTISMNPMLQLSQRQLRVMENIERNTSKHVDNPHKR